MRCAGMTTLSRCAWPILLTLAVGPSAAFAESFACYPFQRGDTASRLAKRITGNASNKYQPWFDIVDVSARSVPKSQYDRVRSRWRACVVEKPVEARREDAAPAVVHAASTRAEHVFSPPSLVAPRTLANHTLIALRSSVNLDPANIWLGAAVVVPALGFVTL